MQLGPVASEVVAPYGGLGVGKDPGPVAHLAREQPPRSRLGVEDLALGENRAKRVGRCGRWAGPPGEVDTPPTALAPAVEVDRARILGQLHAGPVVREARDGPSRTHGERAGRVQAEEIGAAPAEMAHVGAEVGAASARGGRRPAPTWGRGASLVWATCRQHRCLRTGADLPWLRAR